MIIIAGLVMFAGTIADATRQSVSKITPFMMKPIKGLRLRHAAGCYNPRLLQTRFMRMWCSKRDI